MSGYRFWLERYRLTTWLEGEKERIKHLQEAERQRRLAELEQAFRTRLDEMYGRVRLEIEPAKA